MSTLPINKGGTGATTAAKALENLGAISESDVEQVYEYLVGLINDKADINHTHSYAGSSSVGGAANSAEKLDTPRTITLTGAVNGSTSFDGSDDITITTTGDSEAASFLAAHPVGCIYESSSSDNPGTLYGGTWKALPSVAGFIWERTA